MNYRGILIVAAHHSETEAINHVLDLHNAECELLETGVGGISMAWSLHKRLASDSLPKLVINAGIAGSYVSSLKKGDMVLVASDCFADLGIDDNGSFKSIFTAGLANPDLYPFTGGRIYCNNRWFENMKRAFPVVDAATVNMASGSEDVISRIRATWDPSIETMEGAYFAYVCAMAKVPYFCVRSISNVVEPRQKMNWDIAVALKNLEEKFNTVLKIIQAQ
jgi:futalosine hydrolase